MSLSLDERAFVPEITKNENAALFPRLGLSSTLIRHENGAFRKRSPNGRNLKTFASRFGVDGKHFATELFQNDDITLIMRVP